MSGFKIIIAALFLGTFASCKNIPRDEQQPILSHVIFRHGTRTPEPSQTYPTDPYLKVESIISGGLTKPGQTLAYKMGQALRERYKNFLGDIYYNDILRAYTSSIARTESALQCALTGLFPPRPWQMIKEGLEWQPIPYEIIPREVDKYLGVYFYCNDKNPIFNVTSSEESPMIPQMYEYLSEHSGWNVTNSSLVFFIRDTIQTETALGWKQPEWVQKIWPEPLNSLSLLWYKDMVREKLRIGAGNLIRKITEDSVNKANKTLSPQSIKLFLYSGHDETVVFLLDALKAFDGQIPNYSSYVILELYEIGGVYGFKAFYQNYETDDPKPLEILNYGTFCPLDVFVERTQWLYDPEPTC